METGDGMWTYDKPGAAGEHSGGHDGRSLKIRDQLEF